MHIHFSTSSSTQLHMLVGASAILLKRELAWYIFVERPGPLVFT